MEAARKQIGNDNVHGVEVGVHGGLHAREIVTQWKGLKLLYLVDNYICGTRFYGDARVILEPFKEKIKWHVEASVAASLHFDDETLDFVYIDASHAYGSVRADCNAWWKKVRIGGVLCGHDYRLDWLTGDRATPAFKNAHGVVTAVDEFVKLNNLKLNTWVQGSGSDWWIIKK